MYYHMNQQSHKPHPFCPQGSALIFLVMESTYEANISSLPRSINASTTTASVSGFGCLLCSMFSVFCEWGVNEAHVTCRLIRTAKPCGRFYAFACEAYERTHARAVGERHSKQEKKNMKQKTENKKTRKQKTFQTYLRTR